MKLTTARLKKLIREELGRLNEDLNDYIPMITTGGAEKPTPGLAKPQAGRSYLVTLNPNQSGMHKVHLLQKAYRGFPTKTAAMNASLSGERYLVSSEDVKNLFVKDSTVLPYGD
tara:strand:+ start:150 stop:491 length:342 start_codon:yes stop_codon:yes gene_type:complete